MWEVPEASPRSAALMIFRGVLAIVFGILAFTWPGATLLSIAILFGIYAIFDGALALGAGYHRGKAHLPWGFAILEGLLGISAGIVTLLWPAITILVLSVLVGIWALATGVLEVYGAFRIRSVFGAGIFAQLFLALAGIFSVALGIAALAWPVIGAVTLITLIGTYAILFGALFVGLGVQLRKSPEELESSRHERAA